MRFVTTIVTSLFIAMTLGTFGIIWARMNQMEGTLSSHASILATRGERITKVEGVAEFVRLSTEQQLSEQRRIAEDLFQLKLQVQALSPSRRSGP